MIQDKKQRNDDPILKKQLFYEKKTLETIQNTLKFSGLSLESQIDFRAIKIYEIDHLHQIYTKNEQTCLPHMLLLHGFGGTSMTFVRFFKNLKNYYRMHAIDALGVGHSSNGVFRNDFTYEEARSYFVDAIQEWRRRLGIEAFVLVGHSFGGYLAACYTETYQERVSRLILLSPAGATDKTPQQIQQQLKNRYRNDGIRGKFFGFFAETVYNMKIRPSKAMGSLILGQKLIDRIVDVRLKLKHQQRQAWKSYFKSLTQRQSPSESGFYIIFQWPLKPKHTIQSMLTRTNFTKPIEFYYGQYDWMDSCGAERLAKKYGNILFDRISQADHQVIFDNPDQVCYYVMSRRTKEEVELQEKAKIEGEEKKEDSNERISENLPTSLVSP